MMSLLTFDPTRSFTESCELYFCHICVPVPFGLGHHSNNLRGIFIPIQSHWQPALTHIHLRGNYVLTHIHLKGHNLVYNTHF